MKLARRAVAIARRTRLAHACSGAGRALSARPSSESSPECPRTGRAMRHACALGKVTSLDFDYSGQYLAVGGSDARVYASKTWNLLKTWCVARGPWPVAHSLWPIAHKAQAAGQKTRGPTLQPRPMIVCSIVCSMVRSILC